MATDVAPVLSSDDPAPVKANDGPKRLSTLTNLWTSVTSQKAACHRLLVSPFIFATCWWFIAGMHVLNGTIALVIAILYFFVSLPSVYPSVSVMQVSLPLLKISGWAYAVLSVIHWYELVKMVRRSLRSKRLTLRLPPTSSQTKFQQRYAAFQQWVWKPWNLLFGVEGVFGVNGRHFYAAFVAREILEIALQSYQADQLSSLVRRQWITNLAVATIVINSFSTPLVYILLRRNQESARRFVSLLVDMSLDFCCAAIIPLCVVFPYFTAFDRSIGTLPVALITNDVEFLVSLGEIRQFCVTSALDFLATMMPHSTVFTCLSLGKKLVQRSADDHFARKYLVSRRISMAIVVVQDTDTNSLATSTTIPSKSRRNQAREIFFQRVMSAFHVLVILWGAFILGVHARAQSFARDSDVQGCRLLLNAWSAEGVPCSVMQINCHRDGTRGTADEIATALGPLDRGILRKLIITHCPSLEIPTMLGDFHILVDLDIYNSTLTSWPIEAAATSSRLQSLAVFNLAASPYLGFPRGLLHNDLPKRFARFSIGRSNMTELPDELGSLWSNRQFDLLSLQSTNITRLPATFSDTSFRKIRLLDNPFLTTIPDGTISGARLAQITFSRTPLTKFPEILGSTSDLLHVIAEFTSIRSLTPQLQRWYDQGESLGLLGKPRVASLYGSLACTEEKGTDSALCTKSHDSISGAYRWDLVEPQRTLDM